MQNKFILGLFSLMILVFLLTGCTGKLFPDATKFITLTPTGGCASISGQIQNVSKYTVYDIGIQYVYYPSNLSGTYYLPGYSIEPNEIKSFTLIPAGLPSSQLSAKLKIIGNSNGEERTISCP